MGSRTHHPTKFSLIGRDNRRTVRDLAMQYVFKDLRHRIISFELASSAGLPMRELADKFGTIQTPIGEALLKTAPQSGTGLIDAQQDREGHLHRVSVEIEAVRSLALA